MGQRAKPIDLTRTFLPIDPNSLPETMHGTEGEDRPEQRIPVVPYEGWNFMPTGHGWRSYFGLAAVIGIEALAESEKIRDVFIFQEPDLTNTLFALCDSGIWAKSGESAGSWDHEVILTDPDDGTLLEWSHCIIENVLYVHRQANDSVYTYPDSLTGWDSHIPTTINMAGQLGIFKAGNRLGFWDSDNSVAWSSMIDKFDVSPAIDTQANITKIMALIGKIVNILQHGDGFIIYGTKSIVGIQKNLDNTFLWNAESITGAAGIAYRQQACLGAPDTTHYAITSNSFHKIENFKGEVIIPELYDYLKESQSVIYLKMLEGRFLFLQLSDVNYVDGIISFYRQTIPGPTVTLSESIDLYLSTPDGIIQNSLSPAEAVSFMSGYQSQSAHIAVFSEQGGCADSSQYCPTKLYGDYKDNLFLPLSAATLSDPKVTWDSSFSIAGVAESVIPVSFPLGSYELRNESDAILSDATLDGETIVENNEETFYSKAIAIWDNYNVYTRDLITVLTARLPIVSQNGTTEVITSIEGILVPLRLSGGAISAALTYAPVSTKSLTDFAKSNQKLTLAIKSAFEYELGKEGEAYYCIARPVEQYNYSCLIARDPANPPAYRFPMTIEYGSGTGSLAGFSGSAVAVDAADLVTQMNAIIAAADAYGEVTVNFFTLSGTAAFKYLTNGGVESDGDTPLGAVTYSGSLLSGATGSAYGSTITMATTPLPSGITPTNNNGLGSWKRFAFEGDSPGFADETLAECVVSYAPLIDGRHCGWLPNGGTLWEDITHYSDTDNQIYAGKGSVDVNSGSFTLAISCASMISTDIRTVTQSTDTLVYCDTPVDTYLSYCYPTTYRTRVNGAWILSETPVSDFPGITEDVCTLGREGRARPTFQSMSYGNISNIPSFGNVSIGGYTISHIQYDAETFTYPTASFLMQSGTPAPYDVLWKGAYVYDTHFKRWGKMKADYRQLLDFSPINSTTLGTIPYTHFGVNGSLINNTGEIRVFDANPTDSYLKFGKIGTFRFGFTTLEEVRGDFRRPCTGQLEIETSIDGLSVESSLTKTYDYADARQISQGIGSAGRWHNLSFREQFDLTYLEFRAWLSSRR